MVRPPLAMLYHLTLVELPNFQKETVAEALKRDDVPDNIRKLLLIRTQLGKTSTAKYKALNAGVDVEGLLKEIYRVGDSLKQPIGWIRGVETQYLSEQEGE